jgi:hypothetical protein
LRKPNLEANSGTQLTEFHEGLTFRHGGLTCLSCHNGSDYESLRLADGRSVPFAQSMELCRQCHGPQYRDYVKGAHGGMMGYWDLSRGPRTRNSCVHCHDPHAPAFPQVAPVFPPRDRFAPAGETDFKPVPRRSEKEAHP